MGYFSLRVYHHNALPRLVGSVGCERSIGRAISDSRLLLLSQHYSQDAIFGLQKLLAPTLRQGLPRSSFVGTALPIISVSHTPFRTQESMLRRKEWLCCPDSCRCDHGCPASHERIKNCIGDETEHTNQAVCQFLREGSWMLSS